MKFQNWLSVYGSLEFRGECPKEGMEQATFFNRLRTRWPDTLGVIALHPKNEGVRSGKDFQALSKDKALGMAVGASDVIIPGLPAFVCEIKRQDHTKSSWQPRQQEYLLAAKNNGAFVCVALGADAAIQAVEEWLTLCAHQSK